MSAWEEVRRLAADFQRVQASSTAHHLSERNCVELVNKLVELRLVDVVYTVDGKEYVTPQQLEREIRDELAVNRGGRRNRTHVRTYGQVARLLVLRRRRTSGDETNVLPLYSSIPYMHHCMQHVPSSMYVGPNGSQVADPVIPVWTRFTEICTLVEKL